ncbi:hypothetical protein [Scatolibacter rhodanostii]|uniref:hypothetical protein n=1 Tax=Scatolibacter rhodanostii TaxID=2014781 RepID=UPI000C07859C|nr:hypothetical protein [Scatolibacter rhodanostii]
MTSVIIAILAIIGIALTFIGSGIYVLISIINYQFPPQFYLEWGLFFLCILAVCIIRRIRIKKAMNQNQKPIVKNDNIIDVKVCESKRRKRR